MIAQLATLIGRLHPLAVHLPIGILVLLAVLELSTVLGRTGRGGRWPQLTAETRGLILACAAVAAVASAAMGWVLSRQGEYDPALVHRHRLLGLLVAAATVGLLAFSRLRWDAAYRCGVVIAVALLVGAGHTGGTLTHGEGFLLFASVPSRPKLDPATAGAYAAAIQPILTRRCSACHGPAKANGDLRLDTWAALAAGGKHGAVLKAGDPDASRLLQRILAPLDAKEHMPPRGKPQVGDDELALLTWWIGSGAQEKPTWVELNPPENVGGILARQFGLAAWGDPPPDRGRMLALGEEIAARLSIIIRPLTADAPWLEVNARLRGKAFGDAEVAQLAPIAAAIRQLDLGETAVTDAGLDVLKAMKQLERLKLDRTAITDQGLVAVAGLRHLRYLNLYGTPIDDAGLAVLQPVSSLRALYLWQTKATASGARALAEHLTNRRNVQRAETQIAELQNQIRNDSFTFDLGIPAGK